MRSRFLLLALPLLTALLLGCEDASFSILGSDSDRAELVVDGPLSSLGAYRYRDGVRLLECDIRLTARMHGRTRDEARWLEATVDLYDLRTGQYLASDYLYANELADFWGSSVLREDERRTSRTLRYASWGAFRADFRFRYRIDPGREYDVARHVFDCR